MKMKRIMSLVLSACMGAALLSGCGASKMDGTKTVLTVNDEEASVGSLMTMLRYQQAVTYDYYQNMMSSYAQQGLSMNFGDLWDGELPESTSDTDETNETDTEDVDNTSGMNVKTYGNQLVDNIATTLCSYMVVSQHAADYEVSLSYEEQAAIKDVAKEFCDTSDEKSLSANGITEADVVDYLTWYSLYDKVYDAYVASSDITVSDEEAKSMTVSYMRFSVDQTNEDYDTDKEVKQQAEDFLDSCLAEDDATSIDFTSLEEAYSNGYAGTESIAVNDTESDNYAFDVEDIKKLSETENGVLYSKVLDDGNGSYYVMRVDNNDDKDAAASYAETLKETKINDAFADTVQSWTDESEIKYIVDILESIVVTDNVIYTGVSASDSSDTDASASTDETESTDVTESE